ncbi:unnamed protein product [Eretmochelys imbricata]
MRGSEDDALARSQDDAVHVSGGFKSLGRDRGLRSSATPEREGSETRSSGRGGKGSAAQTRGQPGRPSADTMLRRGACQRQPPVQHRAASSRGSQPSFRNQPGGHSNVPGAPLLLLFLVLASWTCACQGVPVPSQELQAEQDLQLWNEIDGACSAYLSIIDPHPEASSALEELCFMVMGFLQKPQGLEEKDNTKRDPNEDTEWNDILRDFGILPPKDEPKDETEEMVLRLQKEAEVKPYERMTLKELNEAEDDFDEDDMKALEMYRQQRLQEWKILQKRQKYGELREISGEQYVKEVTNAQKDVWVVIHLYRSSIPMCLLVNQHLSLLARKFPEIKFIKAIVNSCIQNYHDRCLPTIFVYRNGQIKGRFIGITECGGTNLKIEELEWKLAQVGAIKTDLEENPKQNIKDMMMSSVRSASIHDTNSASRDNDETKCYSHRNF